MLLVFCGCNKVGKFHRIELLNDDEDDGVNDVRHAADVLHCR
jgi:hypothetical protein